MSGSDRKQLQEQLQRAALAGNMEEVGILAAKLKALPAEAQPGTVPSVEGVRNLLQVCTGNLRNERIVLTPHHPLVLRLRAISDALTAEILRVMWTEGWPEPALDELEELEGWGWPEPLRFYGWWAGKDPLVFDAWTRDVGFAWFGQLGLGRELDSGFIGA